MNIIKTTDVSYDNINAIKEAFLSYGINAKLRDDLGMGVSDRVDIVFSSPTEEYDLEVVVMIWVSQEFHEILRFRVVLFNRKERDELKSDDFWGDIEGTASDINQNASAYGALSLSNMVGITVDYNLTMAGGIPDHTIINSAKKLAIGAQDAKWSILRVKERFMKLIKRSLYSF